MHHLQRVLGLSERFACRVVGQPRSTQRHVPPDLVKMRTREGMKVAKAKGRLRGKQPKLKPNQVNHLLELHDSGNYTQAELAQLFGVGRSTIYRTIDRMRPQFVEPERPFGHLVPPNTQTSAPQKS